MSRTRELIRSLLPPAALRAARSVRRTVSSSRTTLPVWEVVPEGWERARRDPFVRGWDVAAVRDWHRRQFALWSQAFEAPNPLGFSAYAATPSDQQLHAHNEHVSFAYVLALATRGRASLSVLDWGGGIGQHFLLARSVIPDVTLSYHCRDLPLVCAVGRELNPEVVFDESEQCLERTYDLVVASNSLQYSEDWRGQLGKLAGAATSFLYIAQLPSVSSSASFVAVQRPYAHGFETEYLGWILNRGEFLDQATRSEFRLTREFFFEHALAVQGVAERPLHRGFLFTPRGPHEGGAA